MTVPRAAWPSPPSPAGLHLLHVDPAPRRAALGTGLLAGHAARRGDRPLGARRHAGDRVPRRRSRSSSRTRRGDAGRSRRLSQDGTSSWRTLGTLQARRFRPASRTASTATAPASTSSRATSPGSRSLRDGEAPTEPRDLAGVLADDGLTLRWIPGTDSSGQLGNVLLYVNGEPYRDFGPTEFEAKLGPFTAERHAQLHARPEGRGRQHQPPDAPRSARCRRSPASRLAEATAALGAAGFTVGTVTRGAERDRRCRARSSSRPTDPVRAGAERDRPRRRTRRTTAPQTRLAFSVAGSKRIDLKKTTTIAVRIKVSRPADVTATLYSTRRSSASTRGRAGQGRRERRQAASAGADPRAGHLQAHLGRALRHGRRSAAPSS